MPEETRQAHLPKKPRRPLSVALAWILLVAAFVTLGMPSNVAAWIGGAVAAFVGVGILVVEYQPLKR